MTPAERKIARAHNLALKDDARPELGFRLLGYRPMIRRASNRGPLRVKVSAS
jgi:hypothetical protein